MGKFSSQLQKRFASSKTTTRSGQVSHKFPKDKGFWGGHCNRSACLAPGAQYYNHGSLAYYCARCAHELSYDDFNFKDSQETWGPGKLLCEFQPTSKPLEPRVWLK